MIPTPRRHQHIFEQCPVVLVRTRYPENTGAVARAMRVTGFRNLILVTPRPLARPSHAQARRMAVGANDILDEAQITSSIAQASHQADLIVATSARRGLSFALSPRELGQLLLGDRMTGKRIALVFGGERSGLRRTEIESCPIVCRIPMVGNEPSLNLSQAVMVVLYEIMVTALSAAK